MLPLEILPQAEENGYPLAISMQRTQLTTIIKHSGMVWFHPRLRDSSLGTFDRGILPN